MLLPFVSIILPVRNEERFISQCLEQLRAQSYPHDRMEVVVADGQSSDGTVQLIQTCSLGTIAVRLVRVASLGRPQGLNAAIGASKGDVILRLDARTRIEPDYINKCVQTLMQSGADNVGGRQVPLWMTLKQRAIGLALSHPFGVGNARFRLGGKSGTVDTVYLGCFWRRVFEKIGLFDETASVISEDSDLNQRILNAGGKVYYNHKISAYYYPRNTFRDQWRVYFRYGGARAGNLLKHKRLTSWRQLVPPIFCCANLFSALLVLVHPIFLAILAGVDLAYVVANTFVSARLAYTHRNAALFPLLWVAFPCMHMAWGMGFWKRLLVPERAGRYWPN